MYDADDMDECNAALVLMSLSGSPNSPRQGESRLLLLVQKALEDIWTNDIERETFDISTNSSCLLYSLGRSRTHIEPRRQYSVVQRHLVAAAERRW